MNRPHPITPRPRGAALLMAMLVVALVASLSAAALWQQWRALAVETAERQRQQASWILGGALDWARLILREDEISNRRERVDHLGEPWALPLAEARLSSFLAVDQSQSADATLEAFLSGEVADLEGRLNFYNLVTTANGRPVPDEDAVKAMTRLFDTLGLPLSELQRCMALLQAALDTTPQATQSPTTPLLPTRWAQLNWLGLSPATLQVLAPHATWLPKRTTLNINTASAEALYAALPASNLAQARQMVDERAAAHFKTLADARRRFPALAEDLGSNERLQVSSHHFEVRGRLRLDDLVVEEVSLIEREDTGQTTIRPVWRERRTPNIKPAGLATPRPTGSLQ